MRQFICLCLLACACVFALLAVDSRRPLAQEPSETTADRTEAELTAVIDTGIEKVWKRDKVKPARQSSDAEFLRRVYLDTVGEPPTLDEAIAFLDDKDADKRDRLIDTLVSDPRFGRHIADQWTNLLTPRRPDALAAGHLLAQWMAQQINGGTGFNAIMREILLAEGSLVDSPTVVPWFAEGEAIRFTDMIGKLTRNFMGVQVQCAECHDHPYDDKLSQKSFQGMAAFLAATQPLIDNNTRPQRAYIKTNAEPAKKILKAAESYDKLTPAQKAQVDEYIDFVRPVNLDGDAADTRDPGVWRSKLAGWMTGSPQTRRYVVNRIWSMAFGSGLYNPVDDFTPLNEASHPELLEALSTDLAESAWDIRRLWRAILKSRAYQLSSEETKAERWHFANYPVRPLNAEQFMATLLGLLNPPQLAKLVKDSREAVLEKAIADLKAAEEAQKKNKDKNQPTYQYDLATMSRYQEQFNAIDGRWFLSRWAAGRYASLSQDDEMTGGENFTMSINQALAVMNGEFTNALATSGKDSLLERLSSKYKTWEDRIDALYLTLLSRRPDAGERSRLRDYFKEARVPTQAAEDLLFALLMTTEFATNH